MAVTLTPAFRGTVPGDNTGDEPYVAFGKLNDSDTALKAAADLVLDIPQSRFLGRITASTGDAEQLTGTQATTLLDVFTSGLKGLVPASGGGTTTFLRADGTFAVAGGAATDLHRVMTIESPLVDDDVGWFFTDVAITLTKLAAVVVGTSTPSVTWTVRHSTDRSLTGNEVVTSGSTTTNTTTGQIITTFNDATIPANSWVWVEITAVSGTVSNLQIDSFGTVD